MLLYDFLFLVYYKIFSFFRLLIHASFWCFIAIDITFSKSNSSFQFALDRIVVVIPYYNNFQLIILFVLRNSYSF